VLFVVILRIVTDLFGTDRLSVPKSPEFPQTHRPYKEVPAFVATHIDAVLSRLLPDATALHLDACTLDNAASRITLQVRSTQTTARCPLCTTPARRIHSHYERTLADLPWAQYRVRLRLRIHKWFCAKRHCRRRIFTERLPTITAPWARHTLRLAQRLVALGVALGGTAGVHLCHRWGLSVSRNTVLRLLRRLPLPSRPTPAILGVDDFALRKRQTYGTVLIDLERRQPVALLPDRTTDTLAQWLRTHPGVKVIARDRASAYAEGARQGAAAATQVADRFHLLQNLREALDQVFVTHGRALEAVNALGRQQPVALSAGAVTVPVPAHDIPRPAQQRAAQRQARRRALHTQVWAWYRQGWTAAAIAQQVGLSLRTVQRDLRSATFAGRRRRSDLGESVLNPYKPYLLERWNAGCHTAMRLLRDLRQRGYAGGYGLVAAYVRRLRQAQGLAPGYRSVRQSLPAVAEPSCRPLTPRRTAWLVLRRAEQRTTAETQQLAQLQAQSVEVAEAITLAQDFATLIRQRQPEALDAWLQRVTASAPEAMRRFALGLYEDYVAVKAGVTLPWSTGPVEGHINRLKMLKRQMFGRAHLDLLSRRFVLASREQQAQAPGLCAPSQVYAEAEAA
jgi:transposase